MHPDLAEYSSRDDFFRRDASWFDETFSQGWFPLARFILIWWNFLAGMIFSVRIHPDLMKYPPRDDFLRPNSSWFDEISSQRWFPSPEFILIWWNFLAEMIFSDRIHPDLMEFSFRDDFLRPNSSWFDGIFSQGWFPPPKCILIWWNFLPGMIPAAQIHPDLLAPRQNPPKNKRETGNLHTDSLFRLKSGCKATALRFPQEPPEQQSYSHGQSHNRWTA